MLKKKQGKEFENTIFCRAIYYMTLETNSSLKEKYEHAQDSSLIIFYHLECLESETTEFCFPIPSFEFLQAE
uniref:Uncharacterized protein n=1 Tax=Onchocerca volvulus TaxID=6282 RepID=A0A8R1U0L5_ONCVO